VSSLEIWIGVGSLVVAVVAVGIAVWQGALSKRQLNLAQQTQGKTEDALREIRELARDNKQLTETIKRDIDQRITDILDLRNENERQSNELGQLFGRELIKSMILDSQSDQNPGGGQQGPRQPRRQRRR